jgi:hypothetical protein
MPRLKNKFLPIVPSAPQLYLPRTRVLLTWKHLLLILAVLRKNSLWRKSLLDSFLLCGNQPDNLVRKLLLQQKHLMVCKD